ncbi:GAP family protein [Mycobacterium shigaense]|uniref:Uncharacterized protein n=1 Tax=Mycobacterium shigaense TaxID=722731 RepID=A0A1Z4EHV4_9MYCO|nr:GAP family protein [Mycobacterium shigaense]MEA1123767.1 GAP family protein [Mycobacterium shigaense]PRI12792.1 hypothetical protein B2J96_24705 [Mycobacterium shigaense]BAX92555.1 hypothetical protein MSG_02411 [Mycobacterium shigaense]
MVHSRPASVPVDGVLFMVAIIVASGAAMTTQLGAAVGFIVVLYAAAEAILAGYLATRSRTRCCCACCTTGRGPTDGKS